MSLLRLSQVNTKTPRMSHRFSLKFEGLSQIMRRVQANATLTNLASTGNTSKTGGIYARLSSAAIGGDAGAAGGSDAIMKNLELSLLSVSVPSIEMETVEVARFHDTAKHISKFSTMGDMNVTFYDYVDGSASAIMFLWQSLVGDKRTGAISYKQEYMLRSARLVEYGPKSPARDEGTEIKLAEHEIVNLYPKSIELGEHSYEGADIRKIQVNFSIDNIYPLYYLNSNEDSDYTSSIAIA
jgi:hypothetical protein